MTAAEIVQHLEGQWTHAPHCGASKIWNPDRLAREFRRRLHAYPQLWDREIYADWIRSVYPHFCVAMQVAEHPPYKDFARELKKLMLRRRDDVKREGKRTARTMYAVGRPDASVIELAAEHYMPA